MSTTEPTSTVEALREECKRLALACLPGFDQGEGAAWHARIKPLLDAIDRLAALASLAVSPEPTEQQILIAAEEAGLWPNTVHRWIPAFHRYHAALNRALGHPVSAVAQPPGAAEALHTAVAAIYFDDSSDYLPALWSIVRRLDPGGIAELLERDGNAAWNKTIGMADAARGIGVRSTTTEGRGPEGAEPGPKDAPKDTDGAASHGGDTSASDAVALMRFYAVDSVAELIAAQARHIERLQAKLPPTPSFAPKRVREG